MSTDYDAFRLQLAAYFSEKVYDATCAEDSEPFTVYVSHYAQYEYPGRTRAQCLLFQDGSGGRVQFGVYRVTAGLDFSEKVLAIRGSDSIADWERNIEIDVDKTDNEVTGVPFYLHRGFSSAAEGILLQARCVLEGSSPVIVTGHSHGGGIASCVVLKSLAGRNYLHKQLSNGALVTFGSPCVVHTGMHISTSNVQEMQQARHRCRKDVLKLLRQSNLKTLHIVNDNDPIPYILGNEQTTNDSHLSLFLHFGGFYNHKFEHSTCCGTCIEGMPGFLAKLAYSIGTGTLKHHKISRYVKVVQTFLSQTSSNQIFPSHWLDSGCDCGNNLINTRNALCVLADVALLALFR